jgi:hypothetical protein
MCISCGSAVAPNESVNLPIGTIDYGARPIHEFVDHKRARNVAPFSCRLQVISLALCRSNSSSVGQTRLSLDEGRLLLAGRRDRGLGGS